MIKFIFFLLFPLLLSANNPKPYAVLGNVIYENAENIQKLLSIAECRLNKEEIHKYIADVNRTKQYGFDLENKKANRDKTVYLDRLRALSKVNDKYLRDAKLEYINSMKENNYKLFSQIINSGLIDAEENKEDIIDYYYKHNEDINSSGIIENYLHQDAKLKAKKEARKKRYKTKKEREAEKIKRIRENDKLQKQKLEEELQRSLYQKKLEIRENQKKELAI